MLKKKPMTLDALARLVAAGFEDVHKRFNDVQLEMATKADLEALEVSLRAELATKLELHDQLEGMEGRLTRDMQTVADQVVFRVLHDPDSTIERRFETIEKRVGKLEKHSR